MEKVLWLHIQEERERTFILRAREGIQTLLFFHAMETGLNIPQAGAYPCGAFPVSSLRSQAEGARDKVSSDPQIRTICGEAEVLVAYRLA